ncbi:ATP-dependent helicase [Litoribacillus peritrichatus]|uniref:DNA 3'-5' helicase n=1 Tax=Litoribacillus peritrichatus TaxID=718191 RepID=A0ABP7MPB1_9GAMM
MKFIKLEDWHPKGIDDLEPNAWLALRRRESTSVIAGPGAGKTEFLAQKAAYLLETGLCPPNKKILAISFKTDAAKNLADRVTERCPQELGSRFVSMTFDAFTKNIVDRFYSAIHGDWKPTQQYEVFFPNKRSVSDFWRRLQSSVPDNYQFSIMSEVRQMTDSTFESNVVGSWRIPAHGIHAPQSARDYIIVSWLLEQIKVSNDGQSSISFTTLNRLAEYIIRTNNHVHRAIKGTYPFVFVDEFQDTTYAQYDLLLSAFGLSEIAVTAVGDYKQRIMGWAGAKDDAFHQFEADFSAQRYPLRLNHRSSPELVRIQQVIAQAIDYEVSELQTNNHNQISGDAAWVCVSRNIDNEASYLAQWIASDLRSSTLKPRDYCVLVRQKPEDYEQQLSSYLTQYGLSLRNESVKIGKTTLQDLLAEELTILFSTLLRLGLGQRNAKVWSQLSAAIQLLRNKNQEDEKALRQVEHQLTNFISELRDAMLQPFTSENTRHVFERVIDFINLKDLRKAYARYATGDLLEINRSALEVFFTHCVESQSSWANFLDEFEGINHIPLMTIHKSKGLEFDTVIFLGIDDNAWWSYQPGNTEGLATFFVALSRAKQRTIFFYCQQRGSRRRVSDFYALLTSAGVKEYEI